MNVLDENIFESQRTLLREWRVPVCQIGHDVGRKGMEDNGIIVLLRRLSRPTLFTRDRDFYKRPLCSDRFCLVHLDVGPLQVAEYSRRLLRHSAFDTWTKRRGCVLRVTPTGISAWRLHATRASRYAWAEPR